MGWDGGHANSRCRTEANVPGWAGVPLAIPSVLVEEVLQLLSSVEAVSVGLSPALLLHLIQLKRRC